MIHFMHGRHFWRYWRRRGEFSLERSRLGCSGPAETNWKTRAASQRPDPAHLASAAQHHPSPSLQAQEQLEQEREKGRVLMAFWGTRVLEIVKKHDSGGLVWKRIKLTTTRKANAKKRLLRVWQVTT